MLDAGSFATRSELPCDKRVAALPLPPERVTPTETPEVAIELSNCHCMLSAYGPLYAATGIAALMAAGLAACGTLAPNQQDSQSFPIGQAARVRHVPAIYVADNVYDSPSLTAYASTAKNDAPPLSRITGSNTLLAEPAALAVSARGILYVANAYGGGTSGLGNVLIFRSNANGDVAPVATITDGVNYPFGIALDSSDNAYVANWQGGSITEYAAGSYQLIRTIAGPDTGLYPVGVAVDSDGKIYAVNNCLCGSGARALPFMQPTRTGIRRRCELLQAQTRSLYIRRAESPSMHSTNFS